MPLSAETQRWRELDAMHHLHPFTVFPELDAKGSRIITSADRCHITDSEGNRIIDGMAGLWCVNVGYGRERLARVAYEQLQQLPYYNAFFQTATVPSVELAAKLAEILPEGLNRLFYASSGSEANDTIVKSVWYYWNLLGKPEKEALHQPYARLSRRRPGVGQPHRHALHARALRSAAAPLPPHRQPLLVRRGR
jgi:putrescine---pyruvate transaminase